MESVALVDAGLLVRLDVEIVIGLLGLATLGNGLLASGLVMLLSRAEALLPLDFLSDLPDFFFSEGWWSELLVPSCIMK